MNYTKTLTKCVVYRQEEHQSKMCDNIFTIALEIKKKENYIRPSNRSGEGNEKEERRGMERRMDDMCKE